MKKQVYLPIVLLVLLGSCYNDLSNDNIDAPEDIIIRGIESHYSATSTADTLKISPEVSSNDPNANFEYFWVVYKMFAYGEVPILDTISHTRELNYLVTLDANDWALIFGAKNTNTGLTRIETSTLEVITAFTRGWYVLKDDGENSDLDLLFTPETIKPASKAENVYSSINGKKLEGQAKLITFFSSYKSYVTDSSSPMALNTRVLSILSENDLSINYINTMQEIAGQDNFCFEKPSVIKPSFLGFSGNQSTYYMINNGLLHQIYKMSLNSGVFSLPAKKNEEHDKYELSQYAVNSGSMALFFDKLTSSFMSHNMSRSTLTIIKDDKGTDMPANNTNKTLLYMGVTENYSRSKPAIAVMKDKADPNMMIVSTISGSYKSLNIQNDTIEPGAKLFEANLFKANLDEKIIYFRVGKSQIWSRNLSSGYERLQYEAPAGEEVTMIRHRSYSPSDDAVFAHNYIIVATSNASQDYKIHFFPKSAGDLAKNPDFTVNGKGHVRDVMYISPEVNDNTYGAGY
ncbi:MAG: PKD-like family lipoprotein [Bacteroidales bacterium]